MKKQNKLIAYICVILCLCSCFMSVGEGVCHASSYSDQVSDIHEHIEDTADYLKDTIKNPSYGSIGGEWTIFGLARADKLKNKLAKKYLANLYAYIKEQNGILSDYKYSDYSRVVIVLSAMGVDAGDFGGYDLIAPISIYDNVVKQGIPGAIFALLALENASCVTGKDYIHYVYREQLLTYILDKELESGGYAIAGSVADVDVTSMVLQLYALYDGDGVNEYFHASVSDEIRNRMKQSIKTSVQILSKRQFEDGRYDNCESNAQVLTASASLGITVENALFVKEQGNLYDGLQLFRIVDGSYRHFIDGESNLMATDQALYAMVAYERFMQGNVGIYCMTDVELNQTYLRYIEKLEDESTEEPSTEDPTTEEPSTEEPTTEEASTEEPTTEEPSTEETSAEEPTTEEASTEVLITEEPNTEDSTTETPTTEDTSAKEQAIKESISAGEDVLACYTMAESIGYQICRLFNMSLPQNQYELYYYAMHKELSSNVQFAENEETSDDELAMEDNQDMDDNQNEQEGSQDMTSGDSEEASDTEKDEDATCTIVIECKTLLNHLDELPKAKRKLVPKSGVILSSKSITIQDGDSVFDILARVIKQYGIHMEYSSPPGYSGCYIEGIANLYEFDCGDLSGWMYSVNSWFPNYGCSQYTVEDGDVIYFRYTCELGNDL